MPAGDVIPHAGGDDTVVPCHSSHLAQTGDGIRHEVNDELRERGVERSVREGQMLGGCPLHGDTRMALARGVDERLRGIHGRHRGRAEQVDQVCGQRAWPTADVDHALARDHAGEVGERRSQRHRVPAHESVIGVGGDGERHDDNLRWRVERPLACSMSTEVFGDATRGDAWAAVRLEVDGERIVAADAPGLERSLVGMTLVEAAAVGGEPLAVEALAAALGPVFRAEPRAGRVAVAMSGGVDSAVALRRAGEDAIGVTLRLWQDPAAPDTERACCSPAAVAAARATCHALGVPHVTLDLREEFKQTIVDPFVDAYRDGRDPQSVHALQRRVSIRRARGICESCGSRRAVDGPLCADRRA